MQRIDLLREQKGLLLAFADNGGGERREDSVSGRTDAP